MGRRRASAGLAVLLTGIIMSAAFLLIRHAYFGPTVIRAVFTTATAVYPGDDVRVSGIKVGRISSIDPQGTQVRVTMDVDHGVAIPADAKAVIVAVNPVAARYVQLTPAYRDSGPTMPAGAVIPIERTAVPVEWDEVKLQLDRLATDLGPSSPLSTPALARIIDSTANALNGNGDKLRQTLAQLSGVGRILANGSGNIADVIKNLQTFVSALRDSNVQIVQFQDRLATLSSLVDENRSDLDGALTNLSSAVVEVQRFVAANRDKASDQIQRLADVTQNLADHRKDLEQVLHVAPNAFANVMNEYNADTGSILASAVVTNFANPAEFICGAIAAVENVTAEEGAKICAQYLGPALRLLNVNELPIPVNQYLMPAQTNVLYTDPKLAPGGAGPTPGVPETPPAVSAYTGLNNDVPPPAGWGSPPGPPGLYTPLPAFPSPAVYPGAPPPTQPTVEGMLLPAESPAPPSEGAPSP